MSLLLFSGSKGIGKKVSFFTKGMRGDVPIRCQHQDLLVEVLFPKHYLKFVPQIMHIQSKTKPNISLLILAGQSKKTNTEWHLPKILYIFDLRIVTIRRTFYSAFSTFHSSLHRWWLHDGSLFCHLQPSSYVACLVPLTSLYKLDLKLFNFCLHPDATYYVNTYCLWQKKTVYDKKRLSPTSFQRSFDKKVFSKYTPCVSKFQAIWDPFRRNSAQFQNKNELLVRGTQRPNVKEVRHKQTS